jgi:hypothetical protein
MAENVSPRADLNAAIVPVELRQLASVLRLPEGATIHSARIDPHEPDKLYLQVTHPSLPLIRQGERLMTVDLLFHEPRVEQRPSEFLMEQTS